MVNKVNSMRSYVFALVMELDGNVIINEYEEGKRRSQGGLTLLHVGS